MQKPPESNVYSREEGLIDWFACLAQRHPANYMYIHGKRASQKCQVRSDQLFASRLHKWSLKSDGGQITTVNSDTLSGDIV